MEYLKSPTRSKIEVQPDELRRAAEYRLTILHVPKLKPGEIYAVISPHNRVNLFSHCVDYFFNAIYFPIKEHGPFAVQFIFP